MNITVAELERQLRETQRDMKGPPFAVHPFMNTLYGMPLIESEVADPKPILKMRGPVDPEFDFVSPRMRVEMDRWLLNRFGATQACAYIMQGFGLVVPRGSAAIIRNFIS